MSVDVENGVLEIFQAHVDKNAGAVTAETPLESLGIHSLELTEIVMDIEDKYGVDVDLSTVETWASFKTVGDMIAEVKKLVGGSA